MAGRVGWRVVDNGKAGVDVDGPAQISSEFIHRMAPVYIHSEGFEAAGADMADLGVVRPIAPVVGKEMVPGDIDPVDWDPAVVEEVGMQPCCRPFASRVGVVTAANSLDNRLEEDKRDD